MRIIDVALGVVLGNTLWGCMPLILLLGLCSAVSSIAFVAEFWWVILIGIGVIALLNIGEGGHQRRHTMGHYATQITGYRPTAYTMTTDWQLKVIAPHGAAYRLPVSYAGCWVGRSHDCHLKLNEAVVSRHHCWIGVRGSYLEIRDNHSRYGIRVNGNSVKKAYLQAGDEVKIGQTRLQIRRS